MRPGTRKWSAALALCTSCFACATRYDPFKVPEESLRTRVQTVAVQPLAVHPDLVEVERVRPWVEQRIVAMLTDAGFSVVTPEEWEQRWLAIAHDIGEIWDPVTGDRDAERFEIAARALRHELAVERGVDAIVWPGLYTVRIEASYPNPTFCGKQDGVYWPHPLPRTTRITLAEGLCLGVLVMDMDEQELYSIRYGIEIVDTYVQQTLASRPVEQRVRDAGSLEAALDEVIGPFARMRSR